MDFNNLKTDYDRLEKKCQQTESHLNEEKDKGKELSSKIIILNNKLDEEKKKTHNLNQLEKQVNKLSNQLESKQNEVIETNKKLKQFDEINSELAKIKDGHQMLKAFNESLETELNKLKIENQNLIKSTNSKHSEFETITSENKNLKQNKAQLNGELANLKQCIEDKDKNFNCELEEMRKKMMILEEQLSSKENEFSSYKIKVTKVLNEKE